DRVGVPAHLRILVAPARVPDPHVDGRVDLRGRGCGARALLIDDLVDELGAASLEDLGDAVQHLAAVVRRGSGPALHGGTGCDDGIPSVLARRLGGVREEGALGRENLVGASGLAAGEGPADRELVRLRYGQSLAHADAPLRYAVRPWRPPSRP